MKIRVSILLLSFLFATPVLPYSTLWIGGVGEPLYQRTARGMGMGGIAIAIPYHIAELNPACISIDETSISLTGVQEIVSTIGDGSDVTSYDFRLPELYLAFPLSWSATVDARYIQIIDADFEVSRQDTIDGEPYLHELSRDGSIANISLGLSKRLHPITVGVRGGMNFGSFLDEQRIHFESGEYKDAYDQFTRELSGFSYEIGVLCRLARIHVGGFYRGKSDLESDLVLPVAYGVGISYSFGGALVGLDYTNSLWHQTDEDYDNAYTAAVGCEYVLGQSKLRTGYRYSSSYYQKIREHVVAAGVGFPLGKRKRGGGLELALEMGMRNNSDQPDMKERLVRLGFTFWGLERWTRRTTYP